MEREGQHTQPSFLPDASLFLDIIRKMAAMDAPGTKDGGPLALGDASSYALQPTQDREGEWKIWQTYFGDHLARTQNRVRSQQRFTLARVTEDM